MLHMLRSSRIFRSALSLGRLVGGGSLILLALSCDNASEYWGQRETYSLSYTCISVDDVACEGQSGGSLSTSIPRVMAVGGRFRVSSVGWLPASQLMIERNGDELEFIRPGYGAILGHTNGGPWFVHLKAAHVASLELKSSLDTSGSSQLAVRGRIRLTATPLDEEGDRLAGLVHYRWSVDDETVMRISRAGRTIEAEGLAPGVATVRVEVGTQAFATYTVYVDHAPVEPTWPVVDGGIGDAGNELYPDADVTSDSGASGSSDVNPDGGSTSDAVDAGETSGDTSDAVSSQLTDATLDGGQP